MAEERKRTTRSRSTASNATTRRSASAKQPSQRARRTPTNEAVDHNATNADRAATSATESAPGGTLGEETWRPEMDDDAATSDAALETEVPPPLAEFDGAVADGATEPIPLPRMQGKATAPMPMITGKATISMPMITGKATIPMPMIPSPTGPSHTAQAKPEAQRGLPFDERWLTLIGGGALVVAGALRRGWPGALLGIAGAGLLTRGIIQTMAGQPIGKRGRRT